MEGGGWHEIVMRRSGNTVKETVYTQFFCLQVERGGGWIDTKFWFGGDTAKEAVYKCTSTC